MSMSETDRFQRVDELFRAALRLPAGERDEYVRDQSGDDQSVLSEVLALLREDQANTGALDRPALGKQIDLHAIRQAQERAPLPDRVACYRIINVLGRGGMGVVYEAEQDVPRRRVALKVINAGVASPKQIRRFEHEVELLARLQHPGIAQIYEAGTFDDGRGAQPFFAMELVQGQPLIQFAQTKTLSTRERLALVARLCEIVHHAHQRGVIHRDLKPSNILVIDDETQSRGIAMPRLSGHEVIAGMPKILDFGVARAIDSDVKFTTIQTDAGQLVGTLPYMSPEQASGEVNEVDTRSDVYSLGVVAYELLTGRLPYEVRDKMLHDAVRIIREDEPTSLSLNDRTLRGDVETIITKSLEKDRTRRYQSASEFGADISRYLNDEPIQARPPSTWYQFCKFAKRNKAAVIAAACVAGAVLAGFAATSAALVAMTNARDEAALRASELSDVAEFQSDQLAGIDMAMMGQHLKNRIVELHRIAAQHGSKDGGSLDDHSQFEQSLAAINFTDVARSALEVNVFDRALTAIDEQFDNQPLVKARLLHTLGITMRELGLLDAATAPQTEAVEIRRRELGDKHPETLQSINSLGVLLMNQGKLAEAEPHCREAFERYREILGDDHPSTLAAMGNLGMILKDEGRLEDAEHFHRGALDGRRRVFGNDDATTLTAINNLAVLLQLRGKTAEAEPLYREALETKRRLFGDDHLDVLFSMNNMGFFLRGQGKFAEAESYHRMALNGQRRALGDLHPDTMMTISSLSETLFMQGKLIEAEPYFHEVLESRRRVLGDDHLDTLTSTNNMAMLLQRQGKYAEAEQFFRVVLDARRRVLGPSHPHTLISIHNMGGINEQMGKLAEAEPYFREAFEARRRAFGDDHQMTLNSTIVLSRVLRDMGRIDESSALATQAVDIARRILPAKHWLVGTALSQHASTLAAQSRFAEAEPIAIEAHAILESALGSADKRTAAINTQIVELYAQWKAAEPDSDADERAIAWQSRLATTAQP